MILETEGLVLRETAVGEYDKILTVLTPSEGVISVSARGSRRIKSRIAPACQQFAYARFSLFKNGERYSAGSAAVIELFFGLRGDIVKLALASYLSELGGYIAGADGGRDSERYIRVLLAAFYTLSRKDRPAPLVKAAAELRLMSEAGYMPDLSACAACGRVDGPLLLDARNGRLVCEGCAAGSACGPLLSVPPAALSAMRYAISAKAEKVFSFSLPEECLASFSEITERYVQTQLDRSFRTLDYYHSIA